MLGGGSSLLLRLAVRSLQVSIGDLARERARALAVRPRAVRPPPQQPGRLQQLIAGATPPDPAAPTEPEAQLHDVTGRAARAGGGPGARAGTACCAPPSTPPATASTRGWSPSRSAAWTPCRPPARCAAGSAPTAGWTRRRPASPARPRPACCTRRPASSALAAAVLRDRAVSDPSPRWDMDITSRSARAASRIAAEVRNGAHLAEAMGREVERIVGRTEDIAGAAPRLPGAHRARRPPRLRRAAVLAADPLPVTLDAAQTAAIDELRAALDTYGDLLVADAVHHLVEGRADIAGQVHGRRRRAEPATRAEPAAHRPRRPRDLQLGRAGPPARARHRAPGGCQPSARSSHRRPRWTRPWPPQLAAQTAQPPTGTSSSARPSARTVTLADLGLTPADALSLTRSTLERLAVEFTGRPRARSPAAAAATGTSAPPSWSG